MKEYTNDKWQYHRVNGPAMVWEDGSCSWRYNDDRHRYYGPAISVLNTEWHYEYWIFDRRIE